MPGPIKTELHTHTADDPQDAIPHTTIELIDRAAALGYGALAVTLHNRQLDLGHLAEYAAGRHLVLIRGMERTIEGKHVLLLNFGSEAERVDSFEALRALKARTPRGLVIAPHPFYPSPTCLGRRLSAHADLFDAVEFNWFYTAGTRLFNALAVRWARRHGRPVVATSDLHRLWQLGTTYTMVDAPRPTADAICRAIREGRVEIRTAPVSIVTALVYFTDLVFGRVLPVRRSPSPAPLRLDDASTPKGQ